PRYAHPLSFFPSLRPSAHPALHSFPTRRSSDLHLKNRKSAYSRWAVLAKSARTCTASNTKMKSSSSTLASSSRTMSSSVSITSRSEEHTSELQSRFDLVCRLLLEKKNENTQHEQ